MHTVDLLEHTLRVAAEAGYQVHIYDPDPKRQEQARAAEKIIRGLVDVFYKYDCALAEINPLVRTRTGEILAIDAKMNFDDNAIFRHKRLQEMFDPTEENPLELRAKEHNLSYIALDGNIGCLVNGAGLAMATMDIIKLHGGDPANSMLARFGGSVTVGGVRIATVAALQLRSICEREMAVAVRPAARSSFTPTAAQMTLPLE